MNKFFPSTNIKIATSEDFCFPKLFMVKRKCKYKREEHPADRIEEELDALLRQTENIEGSLKDKTVAITVGSRGIPQLSKLVKSMGEILKEYGMKPFVVPAMGSHGGATSEGQMEVLAGYDITEETIGMPIKSSMETVCYGEVDGVKVYCDKNAAEADSIIVFNKIKPHTMFHGDFESGLAKMMAIGLGKHHGATAIHNLGFDKFSEIIPKVAVKFLTTFKVLAGVAVVQNEEDEILSTDVIPQDEIWDREPFLLKMAKDHLNKFSVRDIDFLILDEIGKNISGSGFDPNVFARYDDIIHAEHAGTTYKRLYIRSLTPESHGVGTGAPHADVASKDFVEQVDWSATWTNAITCNLALGRGVPIYFDNDREALRAAFKLLEYKDVQDLDILWAKNSLELNEFYVSEHLLNRLKDGSSLIWKKSGENDSVNNDRDDCNSIDYNNAKFNCIEYSEIEFTESGRLISPYNENQ